MHFNKDTNARLQTAPSLLFHFSPDFSRTSPVSQLSSTLHSPWLLGSLWPPHEPGPMDNDTPVYGGCDKESSPHPSSDIYELGVNSTHPRSRATILWLLSCLQPKNAAEMRGAMHAQARHSCLQRHFLSKCPPMQKLLALDQPNTQPNDTVNRRAPRWARWSKGG